MRRIMVDIVLTEPVYAALNQSEAERLGFGPWDQIMALVYDSDSVDPTVEFERVLNMFRAAKAERWTEFLHLDQVLPMLESLPPQAWEMVKGQMRAVLEVNPADFLSKVHCPVLAIFGEADTSIPVEKSVSLYKKYLGEAGNEAVTIKVFPQASHTIQIDDAFAPGYFETINKWLRKIAA